MHYLWQTPKLEKNLSPTCKYILSMETENTEMSEEIGHWWDQVNPIILSNNLFSHNALKHAHLKEYTQDHRVNFPAVIRKVISPDKEGKYIHLHTAALYDNCDPPSYARPWRRRRRWYPPTTLVEPATCIDLPLLWNTHWLLLPFFTQLHCIKFDVDEK